LYDAYPVVVWLGSCRNYTDGHDEVECPADAGIASSGKVEVDTIARFDHLGVHVADRVRTRDWYVETLGLEVEFELPDAGVTAMRDAADFTIFPPRLRTWFRSARCTSG
jgi:hypothetical protein